jgi:hypothetical protein
MLLFLNTHGDFLRLGIRCQKKKKESGRMRFSLDLVGFSLINVPI